MQQLTGRPESVLNGNDGNAGLPHVMWSGDEANASHRTSAGAAAAARRRRIGEPGAAAVALTSRTAPIVDLLIRGRRPVAGIARRAVGRSGEG